MASTHSSSLPTPAIAFSLSSALATPPTLPTAARAAMTAGVIAAHLAGLWALLQVDAVRKAVGEVAPMVVEMVAPRPPSPAPAPAPTPEPTPAPRPQPAKPKPAPVIAAAPAPAPAPAAFTAPAPPEPVQTSPEPIQTPAPAAAAPPAPPAPAEPRRVPASALRYLAQPPVEVPLASRRLRESGTVVLRVVVDIRGLPKSVSVRHSSGFARLDEQAVTAMRAARFAPCTDNGTPIECESDAPIAYELEN